MTTTIGSLTDYLAARRALVEEALARYLTAPPQSPAVVDEAIRYSLLGGGKRLRPLLTLAAAEAVCSARHDARDDARDEARDEVYCAKKEQRNERCDEQRHEQRARDLALPAACAIEMIHTYSLIHDDLPAMDDDSLRRGQPTSHVKFGEGIAILAGDGLLTEAFALLAREPLDSDVPVSLRKLRTIALVATAAGVAGMVGGQAIDLHAARPHRAGPGDPDSHSTAQETRVARPDFQPGPATQPAPVRLTPDALRDMHARKTGALIRAAALAGALMAGASAEAEAAVAGYATNLGLAFQIIDDILDVEGTDQTLGKTAGKDAAAGKPTYPAYFGMEESKRLARDATDRAQAALAAARITGRLPEIAEWVVGRRN
jgi:geranylgeranyl diphosphate synthase, type II